MARNIVVYSDGTGQDGGVRAEQRLSNVYKMYRASRVGPDSAIDPSLQVAFYDPGLGTEDDAHGIGRAWRTVGKFLASVAGRGIGTNIADCYEFIVNHWRPGDRIYIVGFSRGAYTARCVAQVLSLCGVPVHEAERPEEPFRRFRRSTRQAADRAVHQVYEHGAGLPIAKIEAERNEQARRFRADYGSSDGDLANAYPYFVGVFDTVAALGAKGWKYWGLVAGFAVAGAILIGILSGVAHWLTGWRFTPVFLIAAGVAGAAFLIAERSSARREIRDFPSPGDRIVRHVRWRAEDYDRGLSGHVGFARQASSIDEDRADFPRVAWGRSTVVRQQVEGEPPPLAQLWFAGNHSDVGGSYAETESRLSDVALRWMIEEAEGLPHPLLFDHRQLALWPDPGGMQHSEVFRVRDRILWWVPKRFPAVLRDGWSFARRPANGGHMHPSVDARFRRAAVTRADETGPYRPENLREDARYSRFFDGSLAIRDTIRTEASKLVLSLPEQVPDIVPGASSHSLVLELSRLGTVRAAVVFAGDPLEVVDPYLAALRLRELRRAAEGYASPVLRPDGTIAGLLLPRASLDDAKRLARDAGTDWMLEVDAEGRVEIVGTMG